MSADTCNDKDSEETRMNRMRHVAVSFTLILSVSLLAISGRAIAGSDGDAQSKRQEQSEVRAQSKKILAHLYKVSPSAKQAIADAAGYATFSNAGLKILFAGGGRGEGIVVDLRNHNETFMKMLEVQAGLGFGVKNFELIFVFETPDVLSGFVNQGWEYGGQATLAANLGSAGKAYQGALSVSPGIWLYQLTSRGLAAEITLKGAKYYKDDDLN
jgi:lipid-binding SYLF domain-containing protein